MRARTTLVLTGLALTVALVGSGAGAASAAAVPAPRSAAVAAGLAPLAASGAGLTITGRGYGHGRGMGQYGSLGYAVDHGWSSAQIVDHYYGGTRADRIPDLPIGVELLSMRNKVVALTGPGLAVDGARTGSVAVLVERAGAGSVRVRTGPGCAGPWSEGEVRPAGATVTAGEYVEVCEVGRTRGYRGNLTFVEARNGMSVVNQLPIEQYLRGVVPRESPASWASLGGGRGAQALQAQSIAARSYALSATYSSYATTCDTTACQVYGGAITRSMPGGTVTRLEDSRTDAAIAATAGLVRRMPNGAVARTEFSSSTGGWTAGGTFPAVEDKGDGTGANGNRSWTVKLSMADVAAKLGTGPISDIQVSRRSGAGTDGGRALEVVVTSGATRTTFTGSQVRSRLGLKSDWFAFSGFVGAPTAGAVVEALWRDVLGRAPSDADRQQRVAEITGGRSVAAVATDVVQSRERAQGIVASTYRNALGRSPAEGEIQGWISQLQAQGSVPVLQASVLASQESWVRSGGDAGTWVDSVYRTSLGRSAGASERAYWSGMIASRGRYDVSLGIAGSLEAAQRRLTGYYGGLLGRTPDPGAGVHVPRLLGTTDGDRGIPTSLVSSPEYTQRSVARFGG